MRRFRLLPPKSQRRQQDALEAIQASARRHNVAVVVGKVLRIAAVRSGQYWSQRLRTPNAFNGVNEVPAVPMNCDKAAWSL